MGTSDSILPSVPTERRKRILFTFIVFLLLIGFCFLLYVYLTNQITSQRKRILILTNENNELKRKLNKMVSEASLSNTNTIPPPDTSLKENEDF
jgi:Tfp pilus assembly protein PilN